MTRTRRFWLVLVAALTLATLGAVAASPMFAEDHRSVKAAPASLGDARPHALNI